MATVERTNNKENKNSNTTATATTKATKGRQKIQIEKLKNSNSLQVTFSKRRTGLFKKASELCVLCGANVGIIVFSPNGKPYCFGHPNLETVLERYLGGKSTFHDHVDQEEADSSATSGKAQCFDEFNEECQEALEKLQEEKNRTKQIEEEKEERKNKGGFWWDESVENMGLDELEAYYKAMEELRNNVRRRANELKIGDVLSSATTVAHGGGWGNIGFADQSGGFAASAGGSGGYGDFSLGHGGPF
ncbi:hypothetical protein PTKIN_Ptkin10aG0183300 [Pterospermum kingtungense]